MQVIRVKEGIHAGIMLETELRMLDLKLIRQNFLMQKFGVSRSRLVVF